MNKKLEDNRQNPNMFWNEINNLLGKKNNSSNSIKIIVSIRNDDGDLVSDQQAADYMNRYYANIGVQLAKFIDEKEWTPHKHFPYHTPDIFHFRIIT